MVYHGLFRPKKSSLFDIFGPCTVRKAELLCCGPSLFGKYKTNIDDVGGKRRYSQNIIKMTLKVRKPPMETTPFDSRASDSRALIKF